MLFIPSAYRVTARRAFTITELLVAMALATLILGILSQAFVEGLEAFRHLKGIGDLNERLRSASVALRQDVVAAGVAANQFIDNTIQSGVPDRSAAGNLRVRYESIGANALVLEDGLREVQRATKNRVARRLMGQILDVLGGIKWGASVMVQILDLLNPRGTDGRS